MAETKRTYSKGNPEKELLPQQKKKTVEIEAPQAPVGDIQIAAYQKTDIEKMPKAFFVIISGGEVREKDYFKIISHQDKFQRIKLEFISESNKLVNPTRMYELAIYKKERLESSKEKDSEPDRFYLISDVDDFISELIKIHPLCLKENFRLMISNPCFELWLYYAHCCDIPNFPIPDKATKISGKFKGWADTAIRGGVKSKRAIFYIYPNIENAKRNYKEDENGIPMLFSTNMYSLAEDLLPLIEPELTNMIDENKRNEEKFRVRNKK